MGPFMPYLIAMAGIHFLVKQISRTQKQNYYTRICPPPEVLPTELSIHGKNLNISASQLDRILKKRFPYYRHLAEELQLRFLIRLQDFMKRKHFIIKNNEGVKEMPVLVSAAAIQLTFGLASYLFPFYKYIRIYPEEYFRENSFKVLAGNEQGNIISVAWNHFLNDYEKPDDGSNVGLHEMSHALYIQKMVIEEGWARKFSKNYNCLLIASKKACQAEAIGISNLYSLYADSDLQEFWAESVELFFEKTRELQQHYPNVYEAMKVLLNQDPANPSQPVIQNHFSFYQKLIKITPSIQNA